MGFQRNSDAALIRDMNYGKGPATSGAFFYIWNTIYNFRNPCMKPTISLNIIVGNRPEELDRCLSSVHDLFDEVIVTCTQPGDEVRDIVRSHGFRVEEFEWVDDFSRARNYCLSKTSTDYFMWMDSDDILKDDAREGLKDLISNLGSYDVYHLKYNYYHDHLGVPQMVQYRERVIRRGPGVRWVGAIHETVSYPDTYVYSISDIAITHLRSASHDGGERNVRILKKVANEGSGGPREVYYLGRELCHNGDSGIGVLVLERYLLGDIEFVENAADAACHIARHYMSIGKMDEAIKWLRTGNEKFDKYTELHRLLGDAYIATGESSKAAFHYQEAIESVGMSQMFPNPHAHAQHAKVCLSRILAYRPSNRHTAKQLAISAGDTSFAEEISFDYRFDLFHQVDLLFIGSANIIGHRFTPIFDPSSSEVVPYAKTYVIAEDTTRALDLGRFLVKTGQRVGVDIWNEGQTNNLLYMNLAMSSKFLSCPDVAMANRVMGRGIANPVVILSSVHGLRPSSNKDLSYVVGTARELEAYAICFGHLGDYIPVEADNMHTDITSAYSITAAGPGGHYLAMAACFAGIRCGQLNVSPCLGLPIVENHRHASIAMAPNPGSASELFQAQWNKPEPGSRSPLQYAVILGGGEDCRAVASIIAADPCGHIKIITDSGGQYSTRMSVPGGNYRDFLNEESIVYFVNGSVPVTTPLQLGYHNSFVGLHHSEAVLTPDIKKYLGVGDSAVNSDIGVAVIYAGGSWVPWDLDKVEAGMGGSETWAARTARELATLGYTTYLFANLPGSDHIDRHGVYWVDIRRAEVILRDPNLKIDILVSSRVSYPLAYVEDRKDCKKIIIAHDVSLLEDSCLHLADKVGGLSQWHLDYMGLVHPACKDKLVMLANGVDSEMYDLIGITKSNGTVYSSSLDRGFLPLMAILPLIRKVIPDFVVHVAYGTETWESALTSRGIDPMSDEMFAKVQTALHTTEGVVYHGRISKSNLAKLQKSVNTWIYPVFFDETFCITAVENGLAGNEIFTFPRAGLTTTLGGLPSVNFIHTDVWSEWSDSVVDFILKGKTTDPGLIEGVKRYSWKNATKKLLEC